MAVSCDPADLAEAAKCFTCFSPEMREAVRTYLLAVIAGVPLDPVALADAAKCWTCIRDQKALQNYLLCQILNL